jgi:hypothetical protein
MPSSAPASVVMMPSTPFLDGDFLQNRLGSHRDKIHGVAGRPSCVEITERAEEGRDFEFSRHTGTETSQRFAGT